VMNIIENIKYEGERDGGGKHKIWDEQGKE
jgi:hypothetical protein